MHDKYGHLAGRAAGFTLWSYAIRALMDLGLDSLMAVQLRGVLSRELRIALPASLVFDHPTIDSIAVCVLASLGSEEATAPQPTPEPTEFAPRPPAAGAVPTDEEIEAILVGRASHG